MGWRPLLACVLGVAFAAPGEASWETLSFPPPQGRFLHTATRVNDGLAGYFGAIVVAGGRSCASADPSSCTDLADVRKISGTVTSWETGTQPPPMNVARAGHAAAAYSGTKLLVSGGLSPAAGNTAEVLEFVYSTSWTVAAPMNHARAYHTLTARVLDAFVLAAGGATCNAAGVCVPTATAEFYYPPHGWSATGPMATARYKHTATLMLPPNGYVLVAGGLDAAGNSLASAELYDPISLSWIPTGSMGTPRHGHTAELVSVGGKPKVLVTGGTHCAGAICQVLASAELYDPAAGTWSTTGSMSQARTGHGGVAIPGCRTLVAGGSSTGVDALASAEVYDQVTGTWSPTTSMAEARVGARFAMSVKGTAVAVGGSGPGPALGLNSAERFSPCAVGICGSAVASCQCPGCADTDEDGLSDVWETTGADTDCDGAVDLDLAALGANPQHKDVFFEIDYMQGGSPPHTDKPEPGEIAQVVQAFADAPVSNPDGQPGIALHIDLDDALPHYEFLDFELDPSCSGSVTADFDILKLVYFAPSRALAFHYGVWGHRQSCKGDYAGLADQPGDDVSFTPFLYSSDPTYRAALLMHELGHNLGLHHGFGESPNYQSVMNGLFHFGIPPTKRVDYSRAKLPDLNEAALVEVDGIQDGSDQTYYYCGPGGTPVLANGTGPIDWNCNGAIDTQTVQADIDGDASTNGVHKGYNNWQIGGLDMHFQFQCTDGGNEAMVDDGVPAEMDLTTLKRHYLADPLLPVAIDVWPGCDDAPIALRERRDVPVAILASRTVDVAAVDVTSVRFAGAAAASSARRDVNGDRVADLVLQFPTRGMNLVSQSTTGLLLGALRSRQPIQGQAPIRMVDSYTGTCVAR